MSIGTISDCGAWVISAVLLGVMLRDFLKVEIRAKRERKQPQDADESLPSESK
jgi:hypothetical protein